MACTSDGASEVLIVFVHSRLVADSVSAQYSSAGPLAAGGRFCVWPIVQGGPEVISGLWGWVFFFVAFWCFCVLLVNFL